MAYTAMAAEDGERPAYNNNAWPQTRKIRYEQDSDPTLGLLYAAGLRDRTRDLPACRLAIRLWSQVSPLSSTNPYP